MFDVETVEDTHDLFLVINTFTDLYHLCKILDKPTIRTFRSLARADPTPLGRVQVTRLEMGL
jgi:hypothetical protein